MKVYCANCKWLWYDIWKSMCREPNILDNYKDPIDDNMSIIPFCIAVNNDNNCTHYKRKWWKFWIRSK